MNKQDLSNLSQKTRDDGSRLFGVCELIYKVAIVMIWIIGIIGGIASLATMKFSFAMGIGMFLSVAAICFMIYMVAVLSTHVGKVLVHTSFATLGLLEHFSNSTNEKSESISNFSKRNEYTENANSEIPKEPAVDTPIDENDPLYIEGNKLVNSLASHGYDLVKFDSRKKIWILRGGSAEFECNLDQLKDLLKNFS